MPNLVLIGMMGAGKTTVGRLVAERTGMEFIDLDSVIASQADKSIPEIFDSEGEEGFRARETEALKEALAATSAVIATGGGIVMRAENRRLLHELGVVFWLDAPAEALVERIGQDPNRPMLRGGDPLRRLEQLIAERREYYADASNYHLDTTELTPEEMADRIEEELGQQNTLDTALFATIVAIDGPVGSGKSAVARLLASRLGYMHVDTGAMYRCVTLEAMRRGTPIDSDEEVASVAHSVDIRFLQPEDDPTAEKRVLLNGEDVTDEIRTPEVSRLTSPVADVPGVRGELVRLQRQMALRGRSVLEGRDISTVVVPEARWKFYLVASLEERVDRRYKQYELQGQTVDRDELRRDVVDRDERDRERPQGALRLADDAIIFDTTGIGLDETIETMAAMIERQAPTSRT